jgi:hypothetical protein
MCIHLPASTMVEKFLILTVSENQAKKFLIKARIKCAVEGQQWWYMGCTKCNKSVKKANGPFQCSDPQCDGCPAVPRYACSAGT